jgi:hypothetical protein
MSPARLAAIPLLLLSATTWAADVSGLWLGEYHYPNDSQPPVPFSLVIREQNGLFTGREIEPNTFGDAKADLLGALIVGEVTGAQVHFFKKYDGSGGVSHVVAYTGTLDAKGKLSGTWNLGPGITGAFSMARADQSAPAAAPADGGKTMSNF